MSERPTLVDSVTALQARETPGNAYMPAAAQIDAKAGNMDELADEASFHALIPPLAPVVLRVAATLVGVDDAEDAAQEAILRAWRHWGELRDPAAVRPWLLRITVNVCRQWRRSDFGARLRHTQPLTAEQMEMIAALDADPGASDHTGALDLRAAINHLPTQLRLIVALRYYGGMDASEIGDTLTMSPSTVRTRLSRALDMLRERLGARESVRPNPATSPKASAATSPQPEGGR